MANKLKDPDIDFYAPFQSGEGTCYPLYPENYYRVPYTPMFSAKGGKKGGNANITYSNGVDLNLNKKGGKKKQKGGKGLEAPEKFSMFGESSNALTEKFSSTNMGIPYATQGGGKKKRNNSKKRSNSKGGKK